MEKAVETYLHIPPQVAAFISLPTFPLGVDAARLLRVVGAMVRFKLLPQQDASFKVATMIGG